MAGLWNARCAMQARMKPWSAQLTDMRPAGDMDIRALLTQMDGFAAPCGESPYTMRMLPYIAMLRRRGCAV